MVTHDESLVAGAARARRRSFQHVPVVLMIWADFCVAFLTALVSAYAYHALVLGIMPNAPIYLAEAGVLAILFIAIAAARRDYEMTASATPSRMARRRIWTFSLAFSLLVCGLFVVKLSEVFSRGSLIAQYVMVAGALVGTEWWLRRSMAGGWLTGLVPPRKAVLVGRPEDIQRLELGWGGSTTDVRAVPLDGGFADDHETPLARILEACRTTRPDDVVLAVPVHAGRFIDAVAEKLTQMPVSLHLVPLDAARWLKAPVSTRIDNVTTLQIARPPLSQIDLAVKRIFDMVGSVVLLLLLWPVIALAGLAIRLETPGPVIFRQHRHGFFDKPFAIYKLRTMTTMDNGAHIPQATRNDPRITRVGRFLRRWNIDELPQLLNVLKGEMSLVGPRPHAIVHNDAYAAVLAHYARRHRVKPGITGWAQVNGLRGESDTIEKMSRRVDYDLYYIENWSVAFDIRILVMTVLFPSAYRNAF
jgi:Undecaprenyl-phosphate glucose phosphotransferase